ncbi:MAG: glycosyltransferase family 39 protein [Anaerolineae bacterium]
MTNESTVVAPQPIKPRRTLNWPWVLLLIAALVFGAYFRFVGLDWDQGTHRHPDERFLTDVTTRISIPDNLGDYFNSAKSSLNPYNHDFGLFVYGDLPVAMTRLIAEVLDKVCAASPEACLKNSYGVPIGYTAYDGVYLLGRFLSGVLDLFTLIFMFLIGRRLYNVRVGALAAFLGAATVLQIQQSHFYTADIFAAFFATAAVFFVLRFADTNSWGDAVASGVATGLAVACRINVAPLLGVSAIGAFAFVLRQWRNPRRTANFEGAIARILVATVAAVIVFRIFMPYAFDGLFKFDERWTNNMNYIRSLVSTGDDPGGPPGVQWTNRPPIVFSWINIVFWDWVCRSV